MSSGAGTGWNTETWARWVYDLAGADPAEPPTILDLAEAILGAGAVQLVPATLLPGLRARLIELRERHLPGRYGLRAAGTYIQARRKLELPDLAFSVGHELAEWVLRRVAGVTDPDIERQANALGAALVIPRASVTAEQRAFFDLNLARTFCVPPACWALRWGEITGEHVAVVTPERVHRRGECWPFDDAEMRRLARQETPMKWGRPRWRRELRGRRVVLVDQ